MPYNKIVWQRKTHSSFVESYIINQQIVAVKFLIFGILSSIFESIQIVISDYQEMKIRKGIKILLDKRDV